jgi:hypothetical protein
LYLYFIHSYARACGVVITQHANSKEQRATTETKGTTIIERGITRITGFTKRDFYNGIVVVSFSFFINGISRCLLGEKSSCVGFLYGKREMINENTDEIF